MTLTLITSFIVIGYILKVGMNDTLITTSYSFILNGDLQVIKLHKYSEDSGNKFVNIPVSLT